MAVIPVTHVQSMALARSSTDLNVQGGIHLIANLEPIERNDQTAKYGYQHSHPSWWFDFPGSSGGGASPSPQGLLSLSSLVLLRSAYFQKKSVVPLAKHMGTNGVSAFLAGAFPIFSPSSP